MNPRMSGTGGGHMFGSHVVRMVPPMRNVSPRTTDRWQAKLLDHTHLEETAAVVAPKVLRLSENADYGENRHPKLRPTCNLSKISG